MAGFFDQTPQASRLRKWIALTLFALALILALIMLVWWFNLAEWDTEEGPIVNDPTLVGEAEIAPPTPGLYNPARTVPAGPGATPDTAGTAEAATDSPTPDE